MSARPSAIGVACLDREGRWLAIDGDAARLLEVDPRQALRVPWAAAFAPEQAQALASALRQALEQGKAELISALPDRRRRELTLVVGGEQVLCLVRPERANGRDARARLRELEVLTGLSDEVLRWSPPRRVYARALEAVRELCGADRAALLLFDEAGVVRFVAWEGLSDTYRAAVEGHTPWRRDEVGVTPIAIADVRLDVTAGAEVRAAVLREGIRAVAFVPVPGSASLLGKFMLYHDRPHEFSEDDLRLASTLAAHVGFALECKRRDRALRRSEARFRALANSVPLLVWSADARGRATFYNDSALAFSGVSLRDMVDEGWLRVIHPADRPTAIRARDETVRAGQDYQQELRIRRADGAYMWHLVQGKAVRDERGRVERWYGTATNIHTQRVAREQLARQADELREADRRKDDFLAVLGHELRNPLAAIDSATRVLRLPGERARHDWALQTVTTHAGQLGRILDDLLDLTRVSRGVVTLDRRWVRVADVLDRAVEAARPALDERSHELTVDAPPQVQLEADPARLVQVVVNLLTNAARYTPPRGHITVTAAEEAPEQVVLRVRDDGVGIAPEVQAQIFEPFRQVRGDPYERGGLGIGLTLVRQLTELHGGSVQVRSAGPGYGSEFVIRLPRGTPPTVAAPLIAAAPAEATHGLRVLVVEDHPDLAACLGILLETDMGCEVRLAHDGASALQVAQDMQPDAAIVDIGLPDMNGFELARRLRAAHGRAPLLVALSGFGTEEARAEALQAGFDHHLAKPADPERLRELLARSRVR